MTISMQILSLLLGLFSSRIRLQRYEDLAQAPDQTFGEIFNFTGIPFTKGIQEAIHEHTSTALYKRKDRPVKWMFSTYRQQSFKHDHWKEKEELAINVKCFRP